MIETTYESVSHQASSQAVTTLSLTSSQTIQNFVTKDIMSEDIRNDSLNAYVKGKERFVQKSKRLFSLMKLFIEPI